MKKFIQSAALSLLFSILNSQLSTARAQGTAFTYQGRVTDNGANFTGTGLFKFALVTSTNVNAQQATAAANPPSGGFITVINVTFGGAGYVSAPTVTVTGGGGSGCMATAQISPSGVVTNIIVNSPGSSYTSTPTVTVAAPPANIVYTTWWSNDGTSTGGSQPASAVSVGVANGLFTVVLGNTNLPNMTAMPASIFSAQPGLQLMLWFSDGTNGFALVNPVQTLTPTPYAITAGSVSSGGLATGTYGNAVTFSNAANQFTGTFTGNGSGLTNASAATLGGLASSNFWQLGGNTVSAGQFLGSVNNQPLDFQANNLRVMEFAYASNSVSGYGPNVIGGNGANSVSAGVVGATIGGGGMTPSYLTGPNTVTADFGTVVGGATCSASGIYAIAGGSISTASGQYSVALGGFSHASADYSVAMGSSTASGANSTAFGLSKATNSYAFAAGYETVAGGIGSTAMGYQSVASGTNSTAFGNSQATNDYATAAGYQSVAGGQYSTAMGLRSVANGFGSIAMGHSFAYGLESTALGQSEADGNGSFAAGANAYAGHDNSFVWGGSFNTPLSSTAPGQFLISAYGGVGIGLNNPSAALHVASSSAPTAGAPQVQLTQQNSSDAVRLRLNVSGNPGWEMDVASGSSPQLQFWYVAAAGPLVAVDTSGNVYAHTFNPSSDRNLKENFSAVSPRDVLDKVAVLPITRWNFKQDKSVEHLGPMAQDFHAAFGLGTDDKHIATVDEEGVALAAIQGLNEKLETQLKEKDAEIAGLQTRLEKIEQLISSTKGNSK